ncbi:MAG: hypothetical protein CM15mP22_0530 [Gammaproteobacteria bacterium]|nr:MAG: hypothetical protein CM15mP22_0530 [Gammaproteobacteria bacterium]
MGVYYFLVPIYKNHFSEKDLKDAIEFLIPLWQKN